MKRLISHRIVLLHGEDQLVGVRGADLGCSLFRASENISSLPQMAAGFRLAVVVVVISRRTVRKPSCIARNFPRCSPSFSDCAPWLSECLVPRFQIGFGCRP